MSSTDVDSDNIEKLYKNFGILADAKDKISEHEKEYLEILGAVKGSDKEKRLASQFIARFFKHFPHLADQAVEAQIDLCEDEELSIRKQAIKDLPNLCKDNKQHTKKIADILAQLLMAEEATELDAVQQALITLFRFDVKGALEGFFQQILTGEEAVRERCLKFLVHYVKKLDSDVFNKEAEDVLIAECKKVLQDNTADEFDMVMDLLGLTHLAKSVVGQRELVEIVAEQVELSQPYNPADEEQVDKLLHGLKRALPFFSAQVDSQKFVEYLCEQVLPTMPVISASDENSANHSEIFKLLAEFCSHCNTISNPETLTTTVLKKLIEYMPLPPATDDIPEPNLEYSYVECLMYSLHRLARHCPDIITKDPEKLKDFRLRLQYFARGIQGYIKKLKEALHGKTAEELKSEENKMRVIALKMTTNINTLIKDLFHSPPSFKSNVSLSWKPLHSVSKGGANTVTVGQKRHTPITFEEGDNKHSRTDSRPRELYQPPSGKYSKNVSSYTPSQNVRRGGYRGRGRGGRNWRGNNRSWRRGY
ncbi:apoptosis inhibitor 5-like isoform X1 [Macrosteles quadrilineatus]|uniref:apoptosis inhibitor 5-like isoform X1 n=1 Tax=Macrosteles quadrilineatus TaxID=74068 RepID=UPI0023E1F330|nr:apoptosis inhibitor 5-like isoform X1 [Macrosteles quadrilineatus]